MIKTCIKLTLFICIRQKSNSSQATFLTTPPYWKRQKLTQAEYRLRCLIGPTFAIKINVFYTSKVKNSFTEALSDLKSAKIWLHKSWHALKVHKNHTDSEVMLQWFPVGILPPSGFLARPVMKSMQITGKIFI